MQTNRIIESELNLSLTRILQSEMAFRLRVPGVEDLLRDVLRHYLVQHVVRGQRQRLLVHQQPFGQQRVQVVRRHDVVLAPAEEEEEEEGDECIWFFVRLGDSISRTDRQRQKAADDGRERAI